jgi:hypothetical protein
LGVCYVFRQVSLPSIIYVNRTLMFNRHRAEEALNYRPIYDHTASLDRSLQYYRQAKL